MAAQAVCLLLRATLVLIFLVIFDLMNPSVGFFRG